MPSDRAFFIGLIKEEPINISWFLKQSPILDFLIENIKKVPKRISSFQRIEIVKLCDCFCHSLKQFSMFTVGHQIRISGSYFTKWIDSVLKWVSIFAVLKWLGIFVAFVGFFERWCKNFLSRFCVLNNFEYCYVRESHQKMGPKKILQIWQLQMPSK